MVPFNSLGAVSYSPSIVTMVVSIAVCDIFYYLASKNGLTLKTGLGFVQGHWKYRMAPIDKSHTSLKYVSCLHTRSVHLHKYYTVTFKARLKVTQDH